LLKKFCDKYELDYQEIDDTLDYYENMAHLKSLVIQNYRRTYDTLHADRSGLTEWEQRLADWKAQMEQYLDEHFLEYYISCIEAGWTKSDEVGEEYVREPPPAPFSLLEYLKRVEVNEET